MSSVRRRALPVRALAFAGIVLLLVGAAPGGALRDGANPPPGEPLPPPHGLVDVLQDDRALLLLNGIWTKLPDGPPPLVQTGIGPGARQVAPDACTMNFVFLNLTALPDERYGVGTAGHCTESVGQSVAIRRENANLEIGTVAFRVWDGWEQDFALVAVNPSLNNLVQPRVPRIDGPCGFVDAVPGDVVNFYGHGNVVFPQRPASAVTPNEWATWPWNAVLPGDSGGPVLLFGAGPKRAVATISETAFYLMPPTLSISQGRGPTVFDNLELVRAALDPGWVLVNGGGC